MIWPSRGRWWGINREWEIGNRKRESAEKRNEQLSEGKVGAKAEGMEAGEVLGGNG